MLRLFLILMFIGVAAGAEPTLIPHRPNYALPLTYNGNPNQTGPRVTGDRPVKEEEFKFQISLKLLLFRKVRPGDARVYFGYTQLSLWQAYNRGASSPFRETNYEPEGYMEWDTAFGKIRTGAVHQSNGESGLLSRSWDRVFAEVIFERDTFVLAVKPWIRIPESDQDDENPGIERYYGYGEVRGSIKLRRWVLSALVRNNLRVNNNKGFLEISASHPVSSSLLLYIQYVNGYGESLLDYNHPNHRIGVGLAVFDWVSMTPF